MITGALHQGIDHALATQLQQAGAREKVAAQLMDGFRQLPMKALPDLETRLQKTQARFIQLLQEVRIEFLGGRPVVKVAGASETFLAELRLGSSWHAAWDGIDEVVLALVLQEQPST